MIVGAGEFKAKCLRLIDRVNQTHEEIIITKRGKPMARLTGVPQRRPRRVFGCMKGSAVVLGDIIAPIEDEWDANK